MDKISFNPKNAIVNKNWFLTFNINSIFKHKNTLLLYYVY